MVKEQKPSFRTDREASLITLMLLPIRILFLLLPCLLLLAKPAWAVQGHGDPEGLVAHLVGHLLFITATVFLLYHCHRQQLKKSGWRHFRSFLWIILGWNLQTASGHILREYMPAERFLIANGRIAAFQVTNLTDAWFYFTRLDHLLLVPALAFLLAALLEWRKTP